MKINMHIQRLVLDGLSVPFHQQTELQAAVETELARLFTVNVNRSANSLITGGAVSHISAPDIRTEGDSDPGPLGQQIARAVYEGVNQ
jgi:hypothetical protein